MGGSSFDVLAGGSGTGGFHGLLSNLPSHHDVQMLMANSPRRVGFPPSPHAFSLSGIDSLLQSPSAMPGDFRGFDTPISRAVLDPSSIFTPTPRKHPVSRVAQQLFGPTSGVAGCEGAAGDMSGHPLPPHLQNVPRALQQVHELLSMPGQQSGLQIHKNMQPAAGTNEGGEITDEFEMVRALLSSPTFKVRPHAGRTVACMCLPCMNPGLACATATFTNTAWHVNGPAMVCMASERLTPMCTISAHAQPPQLLHPHRSK